MFKYKSEKFLGSLLLAMLIFFPSCEKMIETKPVGSITTDEAYSNEKNIEASLNGIYYKLQQTGNFYSGSFATVYSALSDEAKIGASQSVNNVQFATNEISSTNTIAGILWNVSYDVIYQANSLIEHVQGRTDLNETLRDQFVGEAKWLRAYSYFMLVQYYGNVPLATNTDYRINNILSRTNATEINKFITSELEEAELLLPDGYTLFKGERTRATKQAAQALSARQYLYLKNWEKAEQKASLLISSSLYSLPENYDDVLRPGSQETIFEIWFGASGSPGNFHAQLLVPASIPNPAMPSFLPSDKLVNAFETGDKRMQAFLRFEASPAPGYHYIYKYRDRATLSDRQKLFRLAEQYLIRAEARAQMGTEGADEDINAIRSRAGLGSTTASTKEELLDAVEQERFVELCFEGHRWPDLKRTERIDEIMGISKPSTWQTTDQLLPIPASEIGRNPNLNPQNPGYTN